MHSPCPCGEHGIHGCGHAHWTALFERDFAQHLAETGRIDHISIARIRVSKETIERNVREGTHIPAVYVKQHGVVTWCHEALWDGPSRCVHAKNHVWIETPVQVVTIIQDEPCVVEHIDQEVTQ